MQRMLRIRLLSVAISSCYRSLIQLLIRLLARLLVKLLGRYHGLSLAISHIRSMHFVDSINLIYGGYTCPTSSFFKQSPLDSAHCCCCASSRRCAPNTAAPKSNRKAAKDCCSPREIHNRTMIAASQWRTFGHGDDGGLMRAATRRTALRR